MKIGILAVQGAFIEHEKMLSALGAEWVELRQAKDITEDLDGLILPGGESTAQSTMLHELNMFEPLRRLLLKDTPTLATCAGMILLAQELEGGEAAHFATLPISVQRNAYGRQLGSFKAYGNVGELQDFPMVFIRAPYVTKTAQDVTVLAEVESHIVAVQYRKQLALSFHPELTEDLRLHQKFLSMIAE